MEDYKSGYKLVTKPTLRQNRYLYHIIYQRVTKTKIEEQKNRLQSFF